MVAIDDHLKFHEADLVFSNRADIDNTLLHKNVNQNWFIGPSYCLVNKIKDKTQNIKVKRILLHAGGASYFNMVTKLIVSTFKAAKKYNLNVEVICVTENSRLYIEKLVIEMDCKNFVTTIPFIKNFNNIVFKYDVVVGPAGTITFESIMAQCIPFTIPLINDGRDSEESWPYIGHLMHMNFEESQNEDLLNHSWKVLIKNFKKLKKNLIYFSDKLDGSGPNRVVNKILNKFKNKNNLNDIKQPVKQIDEYFSKSCLSGNARLFLNSRNNQFVRQMSSNPNHIITWPEHVEWWLKSDIYKFAFFLNETIVAFHWSKFIEDEFGDIIISGWFPVKKTSENLKIACLVLNAQVEQVKSTFKNATWIITMRKHNKFVYSINKRVGFKDASSFSVAKVKKHFLMKKNEFDVLEMKL